MAANTYRFPFPSTPDGWFQVAYSEELSAGAVLPLKYFGRDLVLFRTESGEARVLDAHCPHLGAHLGHGGKVCGEDIVCPFHAWRFDGQGQCTAVPYAQKIPPKATLRPWTLREVNGLILIWFHGEGSAPAWDVPMLPEYQAPDWTPYVTRRWKIRTHNQEMAENSEDSAHFLDLHGTQGMPESTAESKGHVFHAVSKTKMRAYGTMIDGLIDVQAFGFGFTLTRFTGLVETLLISSVTNIDPETVDVRFTFTVKKAPNEEITNMVGTKFRQEVERQLEADIPIWENKIYVTPPLLCDGDGPIGLYRKWCKQFYTAKVG